MNHIVHSYNREIVSKIESLPYPPRIIGEIFGKGSTYDMFMVTAGKGKHNVLISGSIHGNEISGAYSVVDFLEKHACKYLDDFTFYAYPCINPFGLEWDKRGNPANKNINREFKEGTNCLEALAVMDSLKHGPERYRFTMDFHECMPSPDKECNISHEFFLWESCRNKKLRLGRKIIEAVEKKFPVCRWDKILGDIADNGVISYPEAMNPNSEFSATFENYLWANYTAQAFTIEVPQMWNIENRIDAHITALCTALDECLKR